MYLHDNNQSGNGTITCGGAANQVAVFSGPSAVAGYADLTYDPATKILALKNLTASGYVNFKSSLFTAGVYGIFHLDEQMFYDADTSGLAVIFNLPLASSVETGRVYCFTDVIGNAAASPVTVNATGGDLINGAVNRQINTAYGSFWIRKNANGSWSAF